MRLILLCCALFLFGCDNSVDDATSTASPEQVSLGFFHAIYVERDVSKAQEYVDAPLKEILGHYHIAASVQRYVLNLSMTNVQMEIDEIDIDFFRKFTDDVTVIVKLKGLKGGSPWIDDRTLRLHKRGKNWVIVDILPEKGRISG